MKKLALVVFMIIYSVAHAEDDFYLVSKDDERMNIAFNKARATLSMFLEAASKRPAEYSAYGAYVKIESDGETEYLWVVDVKPFDEKYYIGIVISEPRLVKSVKYGATIGYTKADIYDWQLKEKISGKILGAYTICAMLDKNRKEDMVYKEKEGFKCDS